MTKTKWSDDYALGLDQIDEQHRGLVETVGRIEELLDQELTESIRQEFGAIYDQLISYVEIHFSTEENLLKEHKFPGFDEHRAEHMLFVSKVLTYYRQWKKGDDESAGHALNFLRVWLINHIQITDALYSEFLRSRGLC